MSVLIYLLIVIALLLLAAAMWTRKLAREAVQTVTQNGSLLPVEGAMMHFVDKGPGNGGPGNGGAGEGGPGDRRTLVLIHGIAGQLQHFTYAMLELLKDDYRVVVVDRPGCGYSSVNSGDGASLGEQARMIDALLGELGVEHCVVVGHSLGGAVALRMALDFPDRVGALALLCPLTHAQPEAPDALKGLQVSTSWLRRLLGATIAVPIAKLTADRMLAQAFAPEQCPDDFMQRGGAALGLRPAAFVAACSDMSAVHLEMPGQAARYGDGLKAGGGVLYGADDALLLPQVHGQPMTAHGLSCETLPGRGHMIPITAPQECAAFVRRVANSA